MRVKYWDKHSKAWRRVEVLAREGKRFLINGTRISCVTSIRFECQKCGKRHSLRNLNRYEGLCKECKMLARHGVANNFQSETAKANIRKTNLERLGVEYPGQSPKSRAKMKRTMVERYGVDHNSRSAELQKKRRNLCKARHGVEHPSQLQNVRRKQSESNKFANKTEHERADILARRSNSFKAAYGTDWGFQSDSVKAKTVATNMERLGVPWPGMNAESLNKSMQTKLTKYGNLNNTDKLIATRRANFLGDIRSGKRVSDVEPLFERYTGAKQKYPWGCKLCGNVFNDSLDFGRYPRCPKCFPLLGGTSVMQKALKGFFDSLGVEVESKSRGIISPQEVDFYLPQFHLAVELDSLYWHSEEWLDRLYHLNKTQQCERAGVRLLHIFEDEWIDKRHIVEARLKNILGLYECRIGARQCTIEEISPKMKGEFLDAYHVQGNDSSVYRYGAFYRGDLLGVMTFSRPRLPMKGVQSEGWELSRFAVKARLNVPGLASKMWQTFVRAVQPKHAFTYADRRWSVGNVYLRMGFRFDSFTEPNYWYTKNQRRLYRFSFRKSRLKGMKSYSPLKTEKQIMKEEGFLRVYDCGTAKFVWP